MAKISNFMYGMVVSIGLFAILALFLSQLMTNYGVSLTSEYNTTFNTLSNITGINTYVESQKNETLAESGTFKTGIDALDLLGYWFERGFSALKSVKSVLDLFYLIVDTGINSLSSFIGIAVTPLKFIIISCVVVAIVIGVILSTLVKREV